MDKESIQLNADVIGIVFPTYYETYGGVPLIVRRFVNKFKNIGSKYLFAICTYGGASVTALKYLDKIIKSHGGKLAAGFTVNMPSNLAGPNLNNTKKQQKMFHIWNENIEVISGYINAKKEIKLDTPNVLFGKAYVLIKLIFNPLIFLFKPSTLNQLKKYSDSSDLPYEELLTTMDNSFYINEKCVGCQNCSRICPVKNIKIVDDTIMAASL